MKGFGMKVNGEAADLNKMTPRNILILKPRLDIPFGKSAYYKNLKADLEPIRVHWKKFVDALENHYVQGPDNVRVLELPLWQMTPNIVEHFNADLTFVPHKEKHNFDCGLQNVHYYMQMVFPWMFSVDHQGWCAGDSKWPIGYDFHEPSEEQLETNVWDVWKKRALEDNDSKFPQPERKDFDHEGFIFFPCQIPHDQTIMNHSDIEVIDALRMTCQFAERMKLKVVAKGHPVNTGSMKDLKHMAMNDFTNCIWVDDVSVHDLLDKCEAVFTVNSGVGMEAILHEKPVFTFGRADYNSVSISVDSEAGIESNWDNRNETIQLYEGFINNWYYSHHDYNDMKAGPELP
jgi:hypothetical protein